MEALPPISTLRSQLESLLLVCDEPTPAADFAKILHATEEEVTELLHEISAEFDTRGSGIELREHQQQWRLYTRQANSHIVEAKLLDGAQQRLSRAALETLAVVAYRQPVTRAQVAGVRGVNCDAVMRTLTLRGLIREIEPAEDMVGKAHLYETTELFLEQLGIDGLDQLPDLAPLLPEVESIEADY